MPPLAPACLCTGNPDFLLLPAAAHPLSAQEMVLSINTLSSKLLASRLVRYPIVNPAGQRTHRFR